MICKIYTRIIIIIIILVLLLLLKDYILTGMQNVTIKFGKAWIIASLNLNVFMVKIKDFEFIFHEIKLSLSPTHRPMRQI